jgi:hypothetical protein
VVVPVCFESRSRLRAGFEVMIPSWVVEENSKVVLLFIHEAQAPQSHIPGGAQVDFQILIERIRN